MFEDIMRMARRESARAGHYYVGVEHLFIALTKVKGGVTANALEENEVTPRFARFMIRQELGRGDNRRFWPGFRETPRLHKVLSRASEMAKKRGKAHPGQRELFLAILQEGNSVPVRVLAKMDADFDRLAFMATEWTTEVRIQQSPVSIRVIADIELDAAGIKVLQQMFRGYESADVERNLEGGYSNARVLVVRPHKVDGRADARVVVKLDEQQAVQYEKMRYDTFVKDSLPPATSRLVGSPIVPDHSPLGGLKYTFVRGYGEANPIDLLAHAREHGPEALADLLWHSLYGVFGETWWQQRQPYHFNGWQEYEFLLPVALVLDAADDLHIPKHQLRPMGPWSRRGRFVPGEAVALEGLTVRRVYHSRQAVQLSAGPGPEAADFSCKVEVRGVDLSSGKFYPGNIIDRVIGRVRHTRQDLLYRRAMALDPDFDLGTDALSGQGGFPMRLPNPLQRYPNLLERRVSGSLSIIHGDLHVRNILVGPGHNAWLIDFALAREGHTLFDWAVLEASLLAELVAPALQSDAWADIWPVLNMLTEMATDGRAPGGPLPVERALLPVAVIRRIVAESLADPTNWGEYFLALAFCALRTLDWPLLSKAARRLLFLVSALAIASTQAAVDTTDSQDTTEQTDLDINSRFPVTPTDT